MAQPSNPVLPSIDPFVHNLTAGERTIGFAILIIVGIGFLAVAAAGTAGFGDHLKWWQAGALSNLTQIEAIAMMAGGGVLGGTAFIVGIIYSVKNSREINALPQQRTHYYKEMAATVKNMEYEFGTGIILKPANPTADEMVIPEVPDIEKLGFDPLTHIPVLIPAVTLEQAFSAVSRRSDFAKAYIEKYGKTEKVDAPYWVIWREGGMPDTDDKSFEEQQHYIGYRGYQTASLIEAIICMAVEQKLFKTNPEPCRCGKRFIYSELRNDSLSSSSDSEEGMHEPMYSAFGLGYTGNGSFFIDSSNAAACTQRKIAAVVRLKLEDFVS